MTRWQRFLYRFPRHPLVAHVVLPPLVFGVLYRFPFDTPRNWASERRAVFGLNSALVAVICALGFGVGFVPVLLVQLPILLVTSIIGVWLFAVQHRYDRSLWTRDRQWNFANAALEGSSVLKLPRILQWFTGNIGFHNVHHLAPRIPNYRLECCYRSVDILQRIAPLSLRSSLAALRLALWDEDEQRLVRFKDVVPAAAK